VTPPPNRKSVAGNPPPTVRAPVLDPTQLVDLDRQALATPLVEHSERAVSSAAPQAVMDDVHRPDLVEEPSLDRPF
jgi:hypothetical protein